MGLNNLYVTGQPNGGTGATPVVGGFNNSQDINANTPQLLEISARFTRFEIFAAIREEIRALDPPSAGLGQVGVINNMTFIPVFQGYDLGGQVSGEAAFDTIRSRVLEVSYKIAPPFRTYPLIRRGDYRVIRNADNTVFPSNSALVIYKAAWPGFPITVQYLSPFTDPVALTDDLTETCGVPFNVIDVVYMGAMLRIAPDREIGRNDLTRQPDPRKPPEVPTGGQLHSADMLNLRYLRRRNEEASTIKRAWPYAETMGH